MPPEQNNSIRPKQGWILRIQKFREGIDLWLLYANLLLNVLYHIEIRMNIRESCLQTGIFIYKPGILVTKQDFYLQNEILGLQTGISACYLPKSQFCKDLFYKNVSRCVDIVNTIRYTIDIDNVEMSKTY